MLILPTTINFKRKFAALYTPPYWQIPHGQAVSMGIILAARLAESLGLTDDLSERLEADFTACGLPVECPYSIETLTDAMKKDKKADGAFVHFVLPLGIGHVETRELRVEEAVSALKDE